MTVIEHPSAPPAGPALSLLWLDLTRACQLECTHCYNASGPQGGHGSMTRADWLAVIDQAAAAGARQVQLIGGEPTLHPDALDLAAHALDRGMAVEVYSNLVHVPGRWWHLFQREGMSVATSYYSHDADTHNAMTGRPASHRHTRANIVRAVAVGVQLRVSIITRDGGSVEATRAELETLGVTRIGVDHIRPYGRGNPGSTNDVSGLCGGCGDGRAAVGPDGTVSPCIMSAWMGVGNTQDEPLAGILTGAPMAQARDTITAAKKDDPAPPPAPTKPCGPDRWCSPGVPDSGCVPRR
ncbi:radical SAM/SPASM domain-containing protein [Nocardiopsis sp. FR26]|uniref:radical SAM/SPASM domain-containing protein n=1 Tax=Nocardiopsis sp. FR26 TaxID=2605987 RepID=UPI001F39F2E7|nr:radical SAM/SPASM domain-containing protein [Nocardiopsis sp. FR26]